MIKFNNPQMGITPQQGIMYRGQAAPAGKRGSYQPSVGIADALTLALSEKPGQAAGHIAIREGTKYGVSNLGDNFYQGGRPTTIGGATTGGLIGAGGALLNGGDARQIAESAGIGAASGAAGTAAANFAASQGASAATSGVLGGAAGGIVTMLGHGLQGKSTKYDAGPMVAGILGQAVLGPIGGKVLSKLTRMGQAGRKAGPKFYEDYTWTTGSPLKFVNGRWVSGQIKDYKAGVSRFGGAGHSKPAPEKYLNYLKRAHERRAAYMADFLNKHKVKADPKHINMYFNNMKGADVDYAKKLNEFMTGETFLRNFNNKDLVNQLNGLATGSHYLTNRGGLVSREDFLDSFESDMTEGGETNPIQLAPGFKPTVPGLLAGVDEDTGETYYYLGPEQDDSEGE